MPYIQLNDTRHPLRVGAMRVGAAADAELRLPGVTDPAAAAVVEVGADQSASIRRAYDGAVVTVNGVQLGVEPTPLIHGDKIELGGCELLYGDDKKGGSTQYVPSMAGFKQGGNAAASPAANGGSPRGGAATAATGGLLRSLVGGREYPVAAMGLVIGRDAGCDVVVPSSEVSRRHAAIAATGAGYELRDTSTNGVWLNGTRIEGAARLGRGDVLRIGGEEFRFYADNAPAAAPVDAAPAPVAATPAPVAPPAPAALAIPAAPVAPPPLVTPMADIELAVPKAAMAEPATDPSGTPVTSAPPARASAPAGPPAKGTLATLEVTNEGLLKGQRFDIRHPLAHVGRGDHNDVVLPEESVSDSHAKLQKRDGRWFVSDVGSTNGTYVAGRRLDGEQELAAGADLRFGGVKMRFQPLADRPEEGKGTRVIAGANVADAARRAQAGNAGGAGGTAAPATRRPAPAPAAAPKATENKSSPLLLFLLLVVLVAAVAAYFLGIGR